MRHRYVCILFWAILLSLVVPQSSQPCAEDSIAATDSLAAHVLSITDLVLDQHIDPPTRQQMILAGVKLLHQASQRPIPRGLSARISEMAERIQLADFLTEVDSQFDQLPNREAVLANGILQSLPGGGFAVEEKADRVQEQLRANRYVGVGIQLSMHEQQKLPQIPKVFFNGPAWQAGVENGDLILDVDEESTAGLSLQQVVEALRGDDGSQVTIVVRQPDSQDTRKLTMTRGRVFIPTVEGFAEESAGQRRYTIDAAQDVAFIRIKSFGASTLHELRQAATKLQQQQIRGIVLDLRVGGGTLHDTIMVASSMLDGGVIGHVKSFETVKKHEAQPGDLFNGIPLAVLVAKQTSAGNVFLTAALQDNKRAVVVGQPTMGETYVRSLLRVPGRGGRIAFATAVMLRGDGTPLLGPRPGQLVVSGAQTLEQARRARQKSFISPDFVVSAGSPTESLSEDPTLLKAIDVLRSTKQEEVGSATGS